MTTILNLYFEKLSNTTFEKISSRINKDTVINLCDTVFKNYLANQEFLASHEYYNSITGKATKIKSMTNFFKEFKYRYSLQGINTVFLELLESKKNILIETALKDPFATYVDYFYKVSLLHNGAIVYKTLTSFFSKFTHTIRPNEFCALDNPIIKYFELDRESFFISYCVINDTYRKWLIRNTETMEYLRISISEIDTENKLQINNLTDIKLLDLIFWFKANRN